MSVFSRGEIQAIFTVLSNFQIYRRKRLLKNIVRLRYFIKNGLHGANHNFTNFDPQKDAIAE